MQTDSYFWLTKGTEEHEGKYEEAEEKLRRVLRLRETMLGKGICDNLTSYCKA